VEVGEVPEDAKLDDLLDERAALSGFDVGTLELKLQGYDYKWFRIETSDQQTPP
jgi:hypothetical protein